MLVIISFCCIVVSLYVLSVLLNYAVLHFETKKIDDLTNQIRPMVGDILNKQHTSRTGRDGSYKNPATKVASRVLLEVKNKQYPEWAYKIVDELNKFRKNAWISTTRLVKYLISLSKPPIDENQIEISPKHVPINNDRNIEDLADRLEQRTSNDNYSDSFQNTTDPIEDQEIQPERKQNQATIDMVSSDTTGEDREMTQFEVQEKRILRRLKQVDKLDDWNAWFDLASLYEKYNELDKASDINCFIMKNGSEADKERAAKNLIGLG